MKESKKGNEKEERINLNKKKKKETQENKILNMFIYNWLCTCLRSDRRVAGTHQNANAHSYIFNI